MGHQIQTLNFLSSGVKRASTFRCFTLALFAVALIAIQAHATLISKTYTITAFSSPNTTVDIDSFDTSLGTLEKVTWTLTSSFSGTAAVKDNSSTVADWGAFGVAAFIKVKASGSATSPSMTNTVQVMGSTDYSVSPDETKFYGYSGSGTPDSQDFTSSSDLDFFKTSGVIPITLAVSQNANITDFTNTTGWASAYVPDRTAGTTFKVEYEYENEPPVAPEPGTIFGGIFCALVFAGRAVQNRIRANKKS